MIACIIKTLCWSGRSDLNGRPSAPKTGQAAYGDLLKLSENKCFWLNGLSLACLSQLILVALGCYDRYKFDYS